LDELINQTWRSNVEGTADAKGALRFRGFYGLYEVTVTRGGVAKTVPLHVSKGGPAEKIVVLN